MFAFTTGCHTESRTWRVSICGLLLGALLLGVFLPTVEAQEKKGKAKPHPAAKGGHGKKPNQNKNKNKIKKKKKNTNKKNKNKKHKTSKKKNRSKKNKQTLRQTNKRVSKRVRVRVHITKRHRFAYWGRRHWHWGFRAGFWGWAPWPRVVAPALVPPVVRTQPVIIKNTRPVVIKETRPVVVKETPLRVKKVFVITYATRNGEPRTTDVSASSASEARESFRADHPTADLKSIEEK